MFDKSFFNPELSFCARVVYQLVLSTKNDGSKYLSGGVFLDLIQVAVRVEGPGSALFLATSMYFFLSAFNLHTCRLSGVSIEKGAPRLACLPTPRTFI